MTKRFKSCAVLELPDDLVGLIFAKLPFLYVFQLRLVCKRWNSLFGDTRLFEHVELKKLPPLFVWQTEGGFAAFSPELNSWQMWPKSFIPVETPLERRWWNLYGGADGLLYLYGKGNSEDVAHLVNPVTRSHKKLPANLSFGGSTRFNKKKVLPFLSFGIVERVYDGKSKSYKIFGQKYGGTSRHALPLPNMLATYNPELGSWEKIGEWEHESDIEMSLPAIHQGAVHCLVTSKNAVTFQNVEVEVRYENRVLRFEGEQSWHQLTATQLPLDLEFVHMFEWQGNLMLAGGKADEDGCLLSVNVWQLDDERDIWLETLTMPNTLLDSFAPHFTLSVDCYSSGDYLYLISRTIDLDSSYNPDGPDVGRLAMCNLSKSSWWEAPEPSSYLQPQSRGFLFKPGCTRI